MSILQVLCIYAGNSNIAVAVDVEVAASVVNNLVATLLLYVFHDGLEFISYKVGRVSKYISVKVEEVKHFYFL